MLYQVIRVNNSFVVEDDQNVPLKYSYATKAIAEYVVKNATAKNAKLLRPQGQDKIYCVSEIRPPTRKPKAVKKAKTPKVEKATQVVEGNVNIFDVAATLRNSLPKEYTIKREGTWLWVYDVPQSDKDSHVILKANGLKFAKGRQAWALKPDGKMIRFKGYRARINTDYEVQVLG
jgi:hypothetical protein